jgi:hypothetical protein
VANVLVATLVLIEFSAVAIVNHDDTAFAVGLSLIPPATVVIWVTALALFACALTARWLLRRGRLLIATSRSSASARPGVWDHWLDSVSGLGPR